ncbi:hypothetical protein SLS58_007163 [Diplodia intermedia]|uniref:Myosin heavy chain n=1 Tax=Diplodia intermedia TaxID=856260 RepID=A0ABR3TLG3_9PEZI
MTAAPSVCDEGSIDGQKSDTDRSSGHDAAIAEFRTQLAEQKAFCEKLQRDVDQKDGVIEALRAEVRSVRNTLAMADSRAIQEWRDRYENVKRLLHDTEEEVEKLEGQLKDAKNREKALQRQLDEAKDDADRMEKVLGNRVKEAEDETRRLRGECDGLPTSGTTTDGWET